MGGKESELISFVFGVGLTLSWSKTSTKVDLHFTMNQPPTDKS
jgi:hypothetical protein